MMGQWLDCTRHRWVGGSKALESETESESEDHDNLNLLGAFPLLSLPDIHHRFTTRPLIVLLSWLPLSLISKPRLSKPCVLTDDHSY
jgi:hypothetical protein